MVHQALLQSSLIKGWAARMQSREDVTIKAAEKK
jgi:hypothetical protein